MRRLRIGEKKKPVMSEDFAYIEKKSRIGEKKKPEMNEDFTYIEKKSKIGDIFKFIAVPRGVPHGVPRDAHSCSIAARMSRCRAIGCSQYEQAIEQALACSIAPSGTACRNAQLPVCMDDDMEEK